MCHLQTEDSVHQLEGQYRAVISALRSKLDSRAAPPILHLDTADLQKVSPSIPTFPTLFSESLVHTGSSWSHLTALVNEIVTIRTQVGAVTEDVSQSATSPNSDASPGVTRSSSSEDFNFIGSGEVTELTSSVLPFSVQSTTSAHTVTEGYRAKTTADPRQTAPAVKTLSLHRKHRSLLYKRQILGASGKSMWHVQFWQKHSVIIFAKILFQQSKLFLTFFSSSLSWGERVLTATQPSQRFLQLGLKHPKHEAAHELPGGKLSFKMSG